MTRWIAGLLICCTALTAHAAGEGRRADDRVELDRQRENERLLTLEREKKWREEEEQRRRSFERLNQDSSAEYRF